jgi:fatty acid desaturase
VEQLALEHRLQADALRRSRERTALAEQRRRRRRRSAVVALLAVGLVSVVAATLWGGWPGRVVAAVLLAAGLISAISDGWDLADRLHRRQ